MKNKEIKKIMIAAPAALAVTVGAGLAVFAYQDGNQFQPTASGRKIQNNQILVPNSEDAAGRSDGQSDEDSSLWEKDSSADEKNRPQNSSRADYMMQSGQWKPEQGQDVLADESFQNQDGNAEDAQNNYMDAGNVFERTEDNSSADVILNNNSQSNGDTTGSSTASNGSSQGNGTSQLPSGGDTTGSDNKDSDKNTNTGGNNSGNSSNSGSNSNSNSNSGTSGGNGNNSNPTPDPDPAPTPDPDPDPTPTPRPADTVKDPESEKSNPDIGTDIGQITNKPYTEGKVPYQEDNLDNSVVFQKPMYLDKNALYRGQKVSQKDIFYALETYVVGSDGNRYLWGADALDRYVRITEVSLDGGETWTNEFPVQIPEDGEEENLLIHAEYRLSLSTGWKKKTITYALENTRLFILSQQVADGDETLDKSWILNADQYPQLGTTVNLMRELSGYLGYDPLTSLFPGWMENGKQVPWYYTTTVGRHILEPMDSVPLDSRYTAWLTFQWMSDDYEVGNQYSNLCYLQTLVAYTPEDSEVDAVTGAIPVLEVPRYIQAVDIDDFVDLHVDCLKIPDTVLYIDTLQGNLKVSEKFEVDPENLNYSSTEEGLLMNKDETQILGIPYLLEDVVIPDTISAVSFPAANQIRTLTLEAQSADAFPYINFENLNSCRILVEEDLMSEFFWNNLTALRKDPSLSIASIQNPEDAYYLDGNQMLRVDGTLAMVLDNGSSAIQLSKNVTVIGERAFAGTMADTLILPSEIQDLTLEKDCFADSCLNLILCSTQGQMELLEAQLENSGAPDNLRLELLQTSREGHAYQMDVVDGVRKVTLVQASDAVSVFDGTLTAEDGTALAITEIADGAFANNTELDWVLLPESVTRIGGQAFRGCTSLQGLLIDAKDEIIIGDQAFDGCDSLRFLASNALYGEFLNGYDPVEESGNAYTFYVPTVNFGYNGSCLYFTEESGVEGYTLEDVGGSRILYGISAAQGRWLAICAGHELPDEVKLPEETVEIFSSAMENTVAASGSGSYTVNWRDLTSLVGVDAYAFRNSQLGGDVIFPEMVSWMQSSSFEGCHAITSITCLGNVSALGETTFANCTSLKSVDFGYMFGYAGVDADTFNGCPELTDITFRSEEAPMLIVLGSAPFQFNSVWTCEEEASHLRIHVPEGCEWTYIKAWRYAMCGSVEAWDTPAYIQLWQKMQFDHLNWDTFEYPTDEEVDFYVKEELCLRENYLRQMFGMDSVEEPTGFFPYRLTDSVYLTLVGAPSYVTDLSLDAYTLDLPFGAALDYIGAGAFSQTPGLQRVQIPDTLAGIYDGAFAGVESEKLTLSFDGFFPPELILSGNGVPFSFGIADEKIHLEVLEGMEEEFINGWIFAMAGYDSMAELRSTVGQILLEEKGEEPTTEEIEARIAEILMQAENRLRLMLGMEQVANVEDMIFDIANADDNTEILPGDGEDGTTDPTDPSNPGGDDIWGDIFAGATGTIVEVPVPADNPVAAAGEQEADADKTGAADAETDGEKKDVTASEAGQDEVDGAKEENKEADREENKEENTETTEKEDKEATETTEDAEEAVSSEVSEEQVMSESEQAPEEEGANE